MRKKVFWIRGSDLSLAMQIAAREEYKFRHSGEHVPRWAERYSRFSENGELWTHRREAKPAFATDIDWLHNTEFPMVDKGGSGFAPTIRAMPRTIK